MQTAEATAPGELLEHLDRTTGLDRTLLTRVVDEVLSYFSETAEAFIVRRHGELQGENLDSGG